MHTSCYYYFFFNLIFECLLSKDQNKNKNCVRFFTKLCIRQSVCLESLFYLLITTIVVVYYYFLNKKQ